MGELQQLEIQEFCNEQYNADMAVTAVSSAVVFSAISVPGTDHTVDKTKIVSVVNTGATACYFIFSKLYLSDPSATTSNKLLNPGDEFVISGRFNSIAAITAAGATTVRLTVFVEGATH